MTPDDADLLVVDDEPFLCDAVAASLRFLGFAVTATETGTDALRLARGRSFDLVVLDVMLPDVDGFEIVRRLRQDVNPGRVLTRAQLLDHVWDYDFGGSTTVVSTYVTYLRRKLAGAGPDRRRAWRRRRGRARLPARPPRHPDAPCPPGPP